MEIRNIITFIRVAELRSFTKAASVLGYSQAAITVQIKQLEQELGTQLFDRVGKTVKLTIYGEKFMPYATNLLKASDDAANFMKREDGISGVLRIGASSSFSAAIMPKIFKEFNKRYPEVRIVVKTTDLLDTMYEKLRQNEVDFMFTLEKKGLFNDCITLIENPEDILLVTNADNPLVNEEELTWDKIMKQQFLSSNSEASYCYYHGIEMAELGYTLEPAIEIGSTSAIVNMLIECGGVAILPRYVADQPIRDGKLVSLDTKMIDMELWTQMLCYKNKWVNPQMQAFIDYMKEFYGVEDNTEDKQ